MAHLEGHRGSSCKDSNLWIWGWVETECCELQARQKHREYRLANIYIGEWQCGVFETEELEVGGLGVMRN